MGSTAIENTLNNMKHPVVHEKHHNHHLNFINIHIPLIHFHNHHHQHGGNGRREMMNNNNHIPKGYVAILVGQGEEEERQRFIIPVMYMNHPLFMQLLKEAEEEYGFEQSGPINIPCQVEEFRNVQCLIDKEISYQHHHQNISWCFRA